MALIDAPWSGTPLLASVAVTLIATYDHLTYLALSVVNERVCKGKDAALVWFDLADSPMELFAVTL